MCRNLSVWTGRWRHRKKGGGVYAAEVSNEDAFSGTFGWVCVRVLLTIAHRQSLTAVISDFIVAFMHMPIGVQVSRVYSDSCVSHRDNFVELLVHVDDPLCIGEVKFGGQLGHSTGTIAHDEDHRGHQTQASCVPRHTRVENNHRTMRHDTLKNWEPSGEQIEEDTSPNIKCANEEEPDTASFAEKLGKVQLIFSRRQDALFATTRRLTEIGESSITDELVKLGTTGRRVSGFTQTQRASILWKVGRAQIWQDARRHGRALLVVSLCGQALRYHRTHVR